MPILRHRQPRHNRASAIIYWAFLRIISLFLTVSRHCRHFSSLLHYCFLISPLICWFTIIFLHRLKLYCCFSRLRRHCFHRVIAFAFIAFAVSIISESIYISYEPTHHMMLLALKISFVISSFSFLHIPIFRFLIFFFSPPPSFYIFIGVFAERHFQPATLFILVSHFLPPLSASPTPARRFLSFSLFSRDIYDQVTLSEPLIRHFHYMIDVTLLHRVISPFFSYHHLLYEYYFLALYFFHIEYFRASIRHYHYWRDLLRSNASTKRSVITSLLALHTNTVSLLFSHVTIVESHFISEYHHWVVEAGNSATVSRSVRRPLAHACFYRRRRVIIYIGASAEWIEMPYR